MRRKACALLITAAMGGCMTMEQGQHGPGCAGSWGAHKGPPMVPGVVGAHGQGIPMAAPYHVAPPPNAYLAQRMMANSVPLDMVQIHRGGNAPALGGVPGGNAPPTPIPAGGVLTPPGVPFAPGVPVAGSVAPIGFTPDGGGVVHAHLPTGVPAHGNVQPAQYAPQAAHGGPVRFTGQRTQIRFAGPTGMKISWYTQGPDGKPAFSSTPLEAPARYNFPQGAVYRLKLSNIKDLPGIERYPTLEVVPCNPKTEAFLAHSAVPITFTAEDFKQVAEGNFVTKVIYLPDPQFQDAAGAGTDEIISTRLEPGADPIQEALRRGSILAIVRMGNVDQEAPNTPPLNAAGPHAPAAAPTLTPSMPSPKFMAPYPGYLPGHGSVSPGAAGPGHARSTVPPPMPPAAATGLPPGLVPSPVPPGSNPSVLSGTTGNVAPLPAAPLPPLPNQSETPLTPVAPPVPPVGAATKGDVPVPVVPPPPLPSATTEAPTAVPTPPGSLPGTANKVDLAPLPPVPPPNPPATNNMVPATPTGSNSAKKANEIGTPSAPEQLPPPVPTLPSAPGVDKSGSLGDAPEKLAPPSPQSKKGPSDAAAPQANKASTPVVGDGKTPPGRVAPSPSSLADNPLLTPGVPPLPDTIVPRPATPASDPVPLPPLPPDVPSTR
ncbi:MAG: hypothetical protein NZO58_03350 [Gemmataceae bacterium]|nr:hypothetical protein [Gemmataceae bacterium]